MGIDSTTAALLILHDRKRRWSALADNDISNNVGMTLGPDTTTYGLYLHNRGDGCKIIFTSEWLLCDYHPFTRTR